VVPGRSTKTKRVEKRYLEPGSQPVSITPVGKAAKQVQGKQALKQLAEGSAGSGDCRGTYKEED